MTKRFIILFTFFTVGIGWAQEEEAEDAEKDSLYFVFLPEELTLEVGDSARVRVTLMNDKGESAERKKYHKEEGRPRPRFNAGGDTFPSAEIGYIR